MDFVGLKLTGFKSFVETTELPIKEGLTGIVGPNGCGKSNLLEAFRWVMGESSAKQMRGDDMYDVIFAGSVKRPPRFWAEVSVQLVADEKSVALKQLGVSDLDISRRIERGKGSFYSVNKKEVRQRDIHLLFADAGIGARSSAIVSQGKIGHLINAKPQERRRFLEEAAGITGLYTRRQEAETKLNSGLNNLERVDDVVVMLENQLRSLEKQVKQLHKYKDLTNVIMILETNIAYNTWQSLIISEKQWHDKELRVSSQVGEIAASIAQYQSRILKEQEVIPDLETQEHEILAKIQNFHINKERFKKDVEQLSQRKNDIQIQIERLKQDKIRETSSIAEAKNNLEDIKQQQLEVKETLAAIESVDSSQQKELVLQLLSDIEEKQKFILSLQQKITALTQQRIFLEKQLDTFEEEKVFLENKIAEVTQKQKELDNPNVDFIDLLEEKVNILETDIKKSMQEHKSLEDDKNSIALPKLRQGQSTLKGYINKVNELKVEIDFVNNNIELCRKGNKNLFDSLEYQKGIEKALLAILTNISDAVDYDNENNRYWRKFDVVISENNLANNLSNFVSGPDFINGRLKLVAVVDSFDELLRLQPSLSFGQFLVTKEGDIGHFDGLIEKGSLLEGVNQEILWQHKLDKLSSLLKDSLELQHSGEEVVEDIEKEVDKLIKKQEELQEGRHYKELQLQQTRSEIVHHQQKLDYYNENQKRSQKELDDLVEKTRILLEKRKQCDDNIYNLEDVASVEWQIEQEDVVLKNLQHKERELSIAIDSKAKSKDDLLKQSVRNDNQIKEWQKRIDISSKRLEELSSLDNDLRYELEEVVLGPEDILNKITAIESEIKKTQKALDDIRENLQTKQNIIYENNSRINEAKDKLSNLNNDLTRIEVNKENLIKQKNEIVQLVLDKFEMEIGEFISAFATTLSEEENDTSRLQRRLQSAQSERDSLGGVNLSAVDEHDEALNKFNHLRSEREDLSQAIDKLKKAIEELNREGRLRLLNVFEVVNRNFAKLFSRLFGGGEAFLKLEGEDPLTSSLEIMASPPGKKLQSLSLLSGGEQTLTALSLLFAVFLSNPAPICILDEVDAPLDDANVDRCCRLIDEISKMTNTKFLVITHHRMTMARMNRLFGVTMSEKGVSQLVGVDLDEAERMID